MQTFDHHSAAFAARWRDQYAELRRACPVVHTPAHGGYTVLTRYADVKRALLTPRTFACGRDLPLPGGRVPGGVTIPTNPFRMGMMEMDAPDGTPFRKLLLPWFSARATDESSPRLLELITWCLDRVIESGHLEVVDDLANPLPAVITLDLLGLPLQHWERYARVLHEAAYREHGSAKQVAWLLADLTGIVERRRAEPHRATTPATTPLDALIAARVGGAPLATEVIVEMVFMLLNGGIDTSTALIAHSVRHLSAHPRLRRQLIDEPHLIPLVVEELLRIYTPGTGLARTVVQPTTVGERRLAPGERVFLALGSANNDDAEFPDPDTVDPARDRNRHLAFGAGVHRCLGSFLAPREMVLLLEQLLTRLPDLQVDEGGVVPYPSIPLVAGFRAMPATFTPGPRIGSTPDDALPPARGEHALHVPADTADEPAREAPATGRGAPR